MRIKARNENARSPDAPFLARGTGLKIELRGLCDSGFVSRVRLLAAVLVMVVVGVTAGCANDSRPADHAKFVEKWINAVSHINGDDLDCKIAYEWIDRSVSPWIDHSYSTCGRVFEHVQGIYLGTREFHEQAGGTTSATTLRDVSFECEVDDWQGSTTKLAVRCHDGEGLGLKVFLANFSGSPETYAVEQVEGDSRHW